MNDGTVDFIGQHQGVCATQMCRQGVHKPGGTHGASGVVGRIQDDHLDLRRAGLQQATEVPLAIAVKQGNFCDLSTCEFDSWTVKVVGGSLDDHRVSWMNEGLDCGEQQGGSSCADGALMLRRVSVTVAF